LEVEILKYGERRGSSYMRRKICEMRAREARRPSLENNREKPSVGSEACLTGMMTSTGVAGVTAYGAWGRLYGGLQWQRRKVTER